MELLKSATLFLPNDPSSNWKKLIVTSNEGAE